MNNSSSRNNIHSLSKLPEDVFHTILQFLGTPRYISNLLKTCKAIYQTLQSQKPHIGQQQSICPHMLFIHGWKKATPQSFLKWARFLGPFRTIHLAADITAIHLPFKFLIRELLEANSNSLEKLEIDVDERIPVCHRELGISFFHRNPELKSEELTGIDLYGGEGRSYEQMILCELLGISDIPYKTSVQNGHILYYKAIQKDVQTIRDLNDAAAHNDYHSSKDCCEYITNSINYFYSDLAASQAFSSSSCRHDSSQMPVSYEDSNSVPRMSALKEIVISLGPWRNELQTMFDRIFSQLAEVRLLQWCSALSRIKTPNVTTLRLNWFALHWFQVHIRSPKDMSTIAGQTAYLFESTMLKFMHSIPSLRVFAFTCPLPIPRSIDWHSRCVNSFTPLWRTLLVGCGQSLEEVHVRAAPSIACALRKASSLDSYYLGVHPGITCPNLRMLSVMPTHPRQFEVSDIELFLRNVLTEDTTVTTVKLSHPTLVFWKVKCPATIRY